MNSDITLAASRLCQCASNTSHVWQQDQQQR